MRRGGPSAATLGGTATGVCGGASDGVYMYMRVCVDEGHRVAKCVQAVLDGWVLGMGMDSEGGGRLRKAVSDSRGSTSLTAQHGKQAGPGDRDGAPGVFARGAARRGRGTGSAEAVSACCVADVACVAPASTAPVVTDGFGLSLAPGVPAYPTQRPL